MYCIICAGLSFPKLHYLLVYVTLIFFCFSPEALYPSFQGCIHVLFFSFAPIPNITLRSLHPLGQWFSKAWGVSELVISASSGTYMKGKKWEGALPTIESWPSTHGKPPHSPADHTDLTE